MTITLSLKEQPVWDAACAAALSGVTANPESGRNSPRDLAHWAVQCADALIMLRRERAGR